VDEVNDRIKVLPANRIPKGGPRLPLAAIAKPPRISRQLNTAAGWLEEMSKVYREARRRQLDSQEAARLGWLCSNAAKLATAVDELRQIEKLTAELARVQRDAGLPMTLLPATMTDADQVTAQDAAGDDDDGDPMPSPVGYAGSPT